ncbi:MAG: right-handed parallel beta-helix repeat-containing protein, partial [Bacteroidetes bacterium]|nr:right-handed parallel beta-helix repeat-containing protein [Bacteroidota bacterium]
MKQLYKAVGSASLVRCILLALGLALSSSSVFALSGNYTIDPSGSGSTNYTSLAAAVSDLNSNGISGDVTFTMSASSFSGGVTISAFTGSGSYDVVFKGAGISSTTVSSTSGYCIYIDDADNITFRDMTISASSSCTRAVYVYDNAENVSIINCKVTQATTSSSTYSAIYVYGVTNYQPNYITIDSCDVQGGYYGIYIRGTSTTSSAAYRVINPTISNSTISGFYYYGAYVYYTWDAQILNNVFDGGTSTYRYSYGLLNYYCNPSSSVSKSRINGNILRNLGARGIYMSSADGYSTSNKSEMYNNVVEGNFDNVTTYSSYAYPCYMSGCDYWEIYHNTFASNNSSYSLTTTSYACLYNSGSYCDVYNNALISSGGYILYLSSSTCNADYNNYYTWSGNGSITAGGGSGANSVNINQGWSSLSSLDITDGCVNGTNLGLTTDVAGNTRNNPPDIGAYEAASGSNDAGVVEILTPKTPLTPGTQTVSIAVKNFGGNNISQVEGNYRVGSGSVVNENLAVTTPIAPCATDTFTFSNTFSMTSGCQNLMVYTTAPNGSSDPVNNNDTTQNLLGIGVSGTFTVGGSGADFSSVDAAFASLTCGGVSGPVVFLLDSGTFTGQIEVPGFAGSSSTNTVTVKGKGKGGTKLTYNQTSSGSSYTTLTFNGCSHVIFRDMTIEASNANYAYAVNFMDGDSNAVRNCDLISSTTSTSTTSVVVVRSSSNTSYSSPATSTNPIVDSCDLTGGYFGIASYGNSASHSEGLTVRNCSFKDYYTYGLYVYYTARVNIHNNYVPLGRNTASSYAMYMYNYHASSVPDGPHFITGNTMHSGNYVYLYATDNGTGTPGEFSNNILSTTSTSYSLYFNGSSSTTYYNRNWKIYNNTVVGLSSSTYGARFYYVDEYDIRNNIFVNNAGSYAAYIYYYSPNGTNRICDNNCYYNGGSSTLVYNYATTLTTSNLNSSSSYDQNSITREVPFKATDDYHLSDACFERGAGVGLTTDIDGDTRNNPPHIGADEVPTAAIDAGIAEIITPNGTVSSGTQTVSVAIKNYGINNLSSYKASYQIGSGSVVTQSKTLSTSLNTCELDTLTFTTTFSHTSGCNQIMAWTSEPNSSTDGVSLNDTNTASYGIPMSGTYTIGGSSPDFVDFDEAFAGLNCAGISGPVVFDVRSGTYSLNRVISNISGQTASDSILFRSASSNSTMPVCEYDASTINDNYLLRFSDASYWTFDGLHLRSKNATYGRVVEFIGASSYIRFSNCKLEGVTTTTTSNYMAVVYDNTGTANQSTYITLDGNTILNGSMGIYLYGGGTGSNLQGNWTIINNQILDYYYYGGYFYYNSDLLFHNNLVSSVSGYYGLYTYYCYTNNRITNNRFMGQGSGYGLYHYYAIGSSTSPDLVANNFIQIGSGSNSAVGLYSYRCGYTGYYHNTVNNTSTYNSSSYPAGYFYYPYSAGVDIKNNIFANTGGGYAYYLEDDPTYVTADYNAVYSTTSGSYLYSYTYGAFSSLSSFSSTTGFDGNSIEANPKFYTDTDLHCITGVLDSAGTYLSAVTMDIDGDTRRNPNPSIGADEYTAIDDDAGISMINSPSVLCSSNSVSVTVGNFGEATLTSATINWSVNGTTQTPYSFTGSIASGGNSVVTIGSFNSSGSSANIVVWTTNPNGKTDLKTSNDTFSQLFNAGLSGNYTVGGSSPDYPTLSDAITAAQNIGICGSVNFLVREGTYTEQVSINPIPGADPSNTLTIKPDPSNTNPVVFEYAATTSTNNYVIAFNGCSFVTVDGLELKNTGASTTYTSVLWFAPSALGTTHHVTVQNCKLEAIPSTYTSYYGGVINMYYYFNSIYQTLEDITIKDNEIINGGSGIYCYGYSSDPYERVNISGNTIRDHGYYSVYMYYTDSATISNNRVNHGCTYTSTLYGIYCYYSDAMTANGNTVIMERPNVSPYNTYNSTMYPFAFFYCDSSVTAMNNKVSVSGNTSTYFMYASRFYYCDAGPDNRNRIINNMFTVSSSNSTAYQIGCEVYNCANTDFMHNSVSINGGPTLSTGALSMYTTVSSTIYGPMVMKNNIFHAGGSGTLALYATGLTTTSGMYDVDYNSFYGDYFGPSHYLTNSFSDYITNSGWDANSVYNDPMFDSLSNLHVNNIELYGTGTNLGITDDIDGDSRGTTPTIGAHEIDPDIEVVSVSLDTLCGAANNAVAVRMTLKNNGDINQMNIPVAFMVDAGTPVMDTITSATLPKGATMTYTLNQTADLSGAADHDVTAYSTQVVDVNRTGDTAMTTIPYWPYPMASFTHADSCLGDAMSFTSTATIALGTTSPTYWSFGDGNTSTAASPTHTYA